MNWVGCYAIAKDVKIGDQGRETLQMDARLHLNHSASVISGASENSGKGRH